MVLQACVLIKRAYANREYEFVVYVLFCSKTKGKMHCLFSEFWNSFSNALFLNMWGNVHLYIHALCTITYEK